jgi:hypothetical protein
MNTLKTVCNECPCPNCITFAACKSQFANHKSMFRLTYKCSILLKYLKKGREGYSCFSVEKYVHTKNIFLGIEQ